VLLTVAATVLAFRAFGAPWAHAFFLGFLVALSSTAVVFKLLDEAGSGMRRTASRRPRSSCSRIWRSCR
jgi:Kef-type K+ transport system membrane component KefB